MNIKNEISSAICDIHDLKKICKAHNVLSARLEDGGLEPTVSDLIHDILYTLESLEHEIDDKDISILEQVKMILKERGDWWRDINIGGIAIIEY